MFTCRQPFVVTSFIRLKKAYTLFLERTCVLNLVITREGFVLRIAISIMTAAFSLFAYKHILWQYFLVLAYLVLVV